jgi:hypothetical protein
LDDAPWPATKDELIDYAIRSGAPLEVIENLQEIKELTQCNILIKRNKNNFFIDYKNKNINTYPILISVYKNNGGNYLPLSGRICNS